jgi:hypothetical protein
LPGGVVEQELATRQEIEADLHVDGWQRA